MEGASLANILNNEQESTEEPAVPATPSQRAGSIHHLVAPYNEPSHRSPSIEHRSSTRSSLADLLSPVDQPVITSNGAVAPQNGLDLLASVGSIEAVRQEESLVEQPRDDSIDDKQEVGGETPPLEDLPAHNDLAAQIFPANESVDPKPEPELPRPALPLPPKPATSLPIRLEYKPSKRLTAPLSVLEPLSKQEHNYYTDPRNCLNPLRTGSGVTLVAEGKFRPSRPDFDEAAAASAETSYSTSRKRERESAEAVSAGPPDQTHPMSPSHSAEFQQQEQQQNEWQDAHHWQAKRQRRGPVDAFNKHSEVAAHYNARGNTGRQARTQSATYGLKVCNNWIKSILIRRFVRRRPGVTDFNPESNPRDTKPNGRVLDMGCGKGGDIEKWNKARVADYVGIDVASGSIQDFEQRLRTSRRRLAYRTHLYVLDCFSYPIDLVVPTDLLTPKFDTVSMQFCMHYAFESERKVRQMLENVAGSLRTGGVFLGTTLSAPKVLELLSYIDENETKLEIGNPYFRIEFLERNHEGIYGHAYRFSLVDAIEDCIEWIVHWDSFQELAKEYGLKQLYRKDFDEVYAEEQDTPESASLAEKMGVTTNGEINMDAEQWSACGMYMAFAFIKTGD